MRLRGLDDCYVSGRQSSENVGMPSGVQTSVVPTTFGVGDHEACSVVTTFSAPLDKCPDEVVERGEQLDGELSNVQSPLRGKWLVDPEYVLVVLDFELTDEWPLVVLPCNLSGMRFDHSQVLCCPIDAQV